MNLRGRINFRRDARVHVGSDPAVLELSREKKNEVKNINRAIETKDAKSDFIVDQIIASRSGGNQVTYSQNIMGLNMHLSNTPKRVHEELAASGVSCSKTQARTIAGKLVTYWDKVFTPFLKEHTRGCVIRVSHDNHVMVSIDSQPQHGKSIAKTLNTTMFQVLTFKGKSAIDSADLKMNFEDAIINNPELLNADLASFDDSKIAVVPPYDGKKTLDIFKRKFFPILEAVDNKEEPLRLLNFKWPDFAPNIPVASSPFPSLTDASAKGT